MHSFTVNFVSFNKDAQMALFASYFPSNSLNYNVMHKRLGHPTVHAPKQVLKYFGHTFASNNKITPDFCSACQFGKSRIQYFPSVETTTQPLELLHADLWGPAPILSSQGYQYYLSILDDFSRFTWIFPLTAKSKALQTFKDFKTMIENSLSKKVKCLQTY